MDHRLDLVSLALRPVAQSPHPNALTPVWQKEIPGVNRNMLEGVPQPVEGGLHCQDLWLCAQRTLEQTPDVLADDKLGLESLNVLANAVGRHPRLPSAV